MTQTIGSADVERFRKAIARCLGLQFESDRLEFLADVLRRRLDAIGQRPDAYLACLESGSCPDEVAALAPDLTVSETYFFRNGDQHRAFAEMALPDRLAVQTSVRRLRILSAGCASGEEVYSLAILIRETVDPSWDVSILGVDVSPAMVEKAKRARYSAWALRETPAPVQHRWFRPEGQEFVLDEALRGAVRFEPRNLVQNDPQLWQPDSYDIVFFRNVLMYLTHEHGRAVIERIADALMPGGYLFLGHAETLRGLSDDFHLQHTHETFYYRRRDRTESAMRPSFAIAPSRGLAPTLVPQVEGGATWIDTIGRATERIGSLTTTDSARPVGARRLGSIPVALTPAWDLGLVLALLREERFAEALELLQRLPPGSVRDPDVLLLNATLLAHRGGLVESEEACKQLLAVDELSAGAHYLLALCRDAALDRASAVYHDQVAIYLDPSFAMPHLHLGLLARRDGDRVAAQRELGQALPLLEREDGSRLLLFGGGFGRETLIELCRTELVGCGGKP